MLKLAKDTERMTKSCKNNYFEKIINTNVRLLESQKYCEYGQDEKKIVRIMPMVADERGVGVKNPENLPTSKMDGPLCVYS